VWLSLMVAVLAGSAGVRAADATGPPSRTQAGAFAHAVNLTSADLPGFTQDPKGATGTGTGTGTGPASPCPGHPVGRGPLLRAESPDFTRDIALQTVNSGVTVLPSSPVASRRLAFAHSAQARRCLARFVERYSHRTKPAGGVSFGRASVSGLPQPAPGADGSFHLRVKITARRGRLSAPFRYEVLGFRVGPAVVLLYTMAVGAPFSAADEQRLFSLLLARATANRTLIDPTSRVAWSTPSERAPGQFRSRSSLSGG